MKTENIFDKLENESTINDSTVIENTGVSTERVLDMVKQEIGSTEKVVHIGKKRKTAIKITALIAAVLTAFVITASALDGFNSAFGLLFAGDSPDGIYSGGNLKIETNENTSVEFLGIAGDDNMVSSALKIRNQDGSPFTDDVENSWIAPTSTDELSDYLYGQFPDTIRYTTPVWYRFKYPNDIDENGERNDYYSTFGFYLDDESTISAYIYTNTYNNGNGAFRGETMTASAEDFSVYTIEETLYDYSEHREENLDEDGWTLNEHFFAALREQFQKYGTGEKNGVRIMVHPESSDIVLAHETPLDISFSISVKMNYKYSTTKLTLKDLDKCFRKWDTGVSGSLSVTPFLATLRVNLDKEMVHSCDEPDNGGFYTADDDVSMYPDELTVILEDGTKVRAYWGGTEADGLYDKDFTVIYQFLANNEDGSRYHPYAIDPNKIASVEANGTVIYEKQ